ncbi:MAG: DUF3465 domain-containing protein [Gammaproteobacteria bacterium]|nr:DUF3465 domain-containing protein [Gammaproteobacteria bacterium]
MPALDLVNLRRGFSVPLLVALLLLAWYLNQYDETTPVPATGDGTVEQAFAGKRSGVWVDTGGRVARLLADDNEGSRHQRFILEMDSGHTLLVSHNIDLADRVPVRKGERLNLRGRYEWNERGGVVHWTHHDPDGSMQGGWIRYQGALYH